MIAHDLKDPLAATVHNPGYVKKRKRGTKKHTQDALQMELDASRQ